MNFNEKPIRKIVVQNLHRKPHCIYIFMRDLFPKIIYFVLRKFKFVSLNVSTRLWVCYPTTNFNCQSMENTVLLLMALRVQFWGYWPLVVVDVIVLLAFPTHHVIISFFVLWSESRSYEFIGLAIRFMLSGKSNRWDKRIL